MKMFRAAPEVSSVLSIGDHVRFVSISVGQFAEMEGVPA